MKKIFTLMLSIILFSSVANATIFYVDPVGGDDMRDASSWGTSVKTVAVASAASALNTTVDSIYVKGGQMDIVTQWSIGNDYFYGSFEGRVGETPATRPMIDADANGIVEPWEFKYPTLVKSAFYNPPSSTSIVPAFNLSAPMLNGFTITHIPLVEPALVGTRPESLMKTFTCTSVNVTFENNIMRDCNVRSIQKSSTGGPIVGGLIAMKGKVKNCLFEKNTVYIDMAYDKPTIPLIDATTAKVTGCIIRNNKATLDFSECGSISTTTFLPTAGNGRGLIFHTIAGVATDTDISKHSAVSNCIITNNEAVYIPFPPNADYPAGGPTTLTTGSVVNVWLLAFNTANTDSLFNCTIANNKATKLKTSGIFIYRGGGAGSHFVMNNVLLNNQNDEIVDNMFIGDAGYTKGMIGNNIMNAGKNGLGWDLSTTFAANNLFDLTAETAKFRKATTVVGKVTDGTVETADWRLGAGSYLIGKGAATTRVKDLAGNSFANPSAVGAYEYATISGVNKLVSDASLLTILNKTIVSKVDGKMQVYAVTGKMISNEKVTIGQSMILQTGVYIVRIQNSSGSFVQKVVL